MPWVDKKKKRPARRFPRGSTDYRSKQAVGSAGCCVACNAEHAAAGHSRIDPYRTEKIMKYLCLGYLDESAWEAMPEKEQEALVAECFAYDRVLRKGGHFVDGHALQDPTSAATVRSRNGKVSVTDGPFAETKEQLGGLLLLEADDLNHAIQLISKHPGTRIGPFEIRPIDEEFTARVNANLAQA
jgi:hypothetical protein